MFEFEEKEMTRYAAPSSPKVFVSHASEDKERFVLGFATRLRDRGVDAWLDKWEMGPGDSLVDRIFEEGLKQALAVIVVLSSASVNKPWVREELNAGVVKRINHGSKLIPVVIENCEVPEALKSTLWERISDLDHYDKELDRIVGAIYGHSEKPPLGAPPSYVSSKIAAVPDLTKIDTLVLRSLYDEAMKTRNVMTPLVPMSAARRLADLGIAQDAFQESLHMLDRQGLISASKASGPFIRNGMPTVRGFEVYGKAFIDGFDQTVHDIMAFVANHIPCGPADVATGVGCPEIIVNFVLRLLDQEGLATVKWSFAGDSVLRVDSALSRRLNTRDMFNE